ncbi:MAG TPA: hypothetical protein VJT71_08300 [Pyrinomonadaceae bacterium]|nr:hypothetical protein [Pyrinomonadaceae bacterium]
MKRLFLIAGLMAAFMLAVASVGASGGINFGGTWTLDKAKSQGLSPRLENAESVNCVITQDDKTISMEWKVTGGQPPAGGGPGSGGGGGRGPSGPQVYNLDGKEVTSEAGGQMGGTNTMKATWSSDGKTLELSSVRTGSFNGNEFKATQVDKLSMSEDGKVLTINRHTESPRGSTDATMVFNKG